MLLNTLNGMDFNCDLFIFRVCNSHACDLEMPTYNRTISYKGRFSRHDSCQSWLKVFVSDGG